MPTIQCSGPVQASARKAKNNTSLWQIWGSYSSGYGILWCVVCWKSTDVSEEYVTFIFRVKEYSKKYASMTAGGKQTRHVPPKRRLTFKGLDSVISQKIELFILLWHPKSFWIKDPSINALVNCLFFHLVSCIPWESVLMMWQDKIKALTSALQIIRN
jgi:hypothetical protein